MAGGDGLTSSVETATLLSLDVSNGSFYGNLTNGSAEEELEWRSTAEMAAVGALLVAVTLLTILGNLLVCVTIIVTPKLHSPTNYFIFSLAATDFLVGCAVLPFSTVNTVMPYWPLGSIFCNIFGSTDVMLCTVSILTLFAISLDRYFAINVPFAYQQRISSKLVWKIVGAIWLFSFVMAFVPIHVGWNTPSGAVQNYENPRACVFELNKPYSLLIAIFTYFGPLLVMCGVYAKVLFVTRRQVREINRTQSMRATLPILNSNGYEDGRRDSERTAARRETKITRIASDRKATLTLATLVLCFAVCWIPYFSLFTLKPFVDLNINVHADLFCLWLGYVNSTINPFLYGFYNSGFRRGFKHVLCSACLRYRRRADASFLPTQPPRRLRNTTSMESSELPELGVRLT